MNATTFQKVFLTILAIYLLSQAAGFIVGMNFQSFRTTTTDTLKTQTSYAITSPLIERTDLITSTFIITINNIICCILLLSLGIITKYRESFGEYALKVSYFAAIVPSFIIGVVFAGATPFFFLQVILEFGILEFLCYVLCITWSLQTIKKQDVPNLIRTFLIITPTLFIAAIIENIIFLRAG